jgi:hypothetical protein
MPDKQAESNKKSIGAIEVFVTLNTLFMTITAAGFGWGALTIINNSTRIQAIEISGEYAAQDRWTGRMEAAIQEIENPTAEDVIRIQKKYRP